MYELSDYLAMIDDQRRTSAYLRALSATVRPGDVVLELGTGFGYFAVAAARLGAAHVWAVEPNDAIDLGPSLAAQHGVSDRITFVQGRSSRIELSVRADVLLEDLRGCSPLLGGRLGILQDARRRLLKPDSRYVALRDHLIAAPAVLRPRENVWSTAPAKAVADGADDAPAAGIAASADSIDLSAVRAVVGRGWRRIHARGFTPLATGARWATLDLSKDEGLDVDGGAEFSIEEDGLFEGWATWFEADLAGGARISSGPESGASVYDCGWYPLDAPLPVRAGDRVALRMRATFDGTDYVWVWETTCTPADGGARRRSRQSTLAQQLLSSAQLGRRSASYVPGVVESVVLQRDLLQAVNGVRTLDEIVAALRTAHPSRLADARAALAWVAAELARLDEASP